MSLFFLFSLPILLSSPPYPYDTSYRIDCGGADNFTSEFNQSWIADRFYTGGSPALVATPHDFQLPQERTLRFFPISSGKKNCYLVNVPNGRYNIRTFTVYDNYDSKLHSPSFDVSVEGTVVFSWRSPWEEDQSRTGAYSDVFAFVNDGEVAVCFYSIATDAPVIGSLEIVQVDPLSYDSSTAGRDMILVNYGRFTCGSNMFGSGFSNDTDLFGRAWQSDSEVRDKNLKVKTLSTQTYIRGTNQAPNYFPTHLYQTAIIVPGGGSLEYKLTVDTRLDYLIWFHFAEIDSSVKMAGQRIFDIYINQKNVKRIDIFKESGNFAAFKWYYVVQNLNSTLLRVKLVPIVGPPLISGLENYAMVPLDLSTVPSEVTAMRALKESLRIPDRMGWNGDPCAPSTWDAWEGVTCHRNAEGNGLVITQLTMSSHNAITSQVPLLKVRPILPSTLAEWVRSLREEEMTWLKQHRLAECLDLFDVIIDWGMLRTAVTFWNPQFHLFQFNHLEVSPSLEDIAALLNLPLEGHIRFLRHQPAYFQLAEELLGLTPTDIRDMLLNDNSLIDREKFQRRFLSERPSQGCSQQNMEAFSFCLIETLFFPSKGRGFNLRMLSIFKLWKEGITLVPYILAELYTALTSSYAGQADSLYGCVPYLQVWLWERLRLIHPPRPRIFYVPQLLKTILKKCCIPYEERATNEQNVGWFRSLAPDTIAWHSVWVKSSPFICDRRLQSLILPHFQAVVGYYPFRFLRLFGYVQIKPTIQTPKDAIWVYSKNNLGRMIDRLEEGWKNKRTAAELSFEESIIPSTTPEYDEWILTFASEASHCEVEIGKGKAILGIEENREREKQLEAPTFITPLAVEGSVSTAGNETSHSRKRPSHEQWQVTDESPQSTDSLRKQLQEKEKQVKEISERNLKLKEAFKQSENQGRRACEKIAALKAQHAEELATMKIQHQQALEKERKRYKNLWQRHQEVTQELQQHEERAAQIARIMGGHPPTSRAP